MFIHVIENYDFDYEEEEEDIFQRVETRCVGQDSYHSDSRSLRSVFVVMLAGWLIYENTSNISITV